MTASVHTIGRLLLPASQGNHPGNDAVATANRQASVVLGMHRGGTSAMAGTLGLLGAAFGKRMMPADHNNAHGYWENLRFVEFNDRVLRSFGASWDSPFRLPVEWIDTARGVRESARLQSVLADEFGASGTVAIKDPRVSRLLPLWRHALANAGYQVSYVLVVRHPDEVARSLLKRDGFTRDKAHLLWLQHMLQAEAETRGQRRTIVFYDDLIEQGTSCVERVQRELDLRLPQAAQHAAARMSQFLASSLRHHRAAHVATPSSDPLAFVNAVYRQMLAAPSGRIASSPNLDRQAYLRLTETVLAQTTRERHRESRKSLQIYQRLQRARAHGIKALAVQEQAADLVAELPRRAVANPHLPGLRAHDVCKVYWRNDDTLYGEDRAYGVSYAVGQLDVAFDVSIPCGSTLPAFLRIDPSEWPGIFSIESIAIDGQSLQDVNARISLLNGQRLDFATEDLRFAALDADPYVELDLKDLHHARSDGGSIRIAFRVARTEVQSELARIAHRDLGLQRALDAQRAELSGILQGVDRLTEQARTDREASSTKTEAQLSDVAQTRGAIEVCQVVLDQHADMLDTLLEGNDALRDSTATAVRQLDETCASVVRLSAQVEAQSCAINEMASSFNLAIDQNTRITSLTTMLEMMSARFDALAREREDDVGRANGTNVMVATGVDSLHARLDAIDAQQAIAHTWIRRRSPRYWLRRWFGA